MSKISGVFKIGYENLTTIKFIITYIVCWDVFRIVNTIGIYD
jgi:hypothetical protein